MKSFLPGMSVSGLFLSSHDHSLERRMLLMLEFAEKEAVSLSSI